MSSKENSLFETISGTILKPAIFLVDRLSYARKFLFIGVVLLVPLAFLLRLQFVGTTHALEFNAKERVGIEYITPAKDLLLALQRRRIFDVAARLGIGDQKANLESATKAIESELARLDEVDARLGSTLGTRERWTRIKGAWSRVRQDSTLSAQQSDSAHAALSASVAELIAIDVGNNSNLILDPDLDSYWLMDAWVLKLPAMSQNIAGTATGALFLASDSSAERKFDIAGDTRALKTTTSDLVTVNMKTAFAETKNPKFGQSPTLEPRLRTPLREATQSVDEYTALVRQVAEQSQVAERAERSHKLIELALGTLASTDKLDALIAPELDWLCKKRVDDQRGVRSLGLQAGLLAAGLLTYVFLGFYASVRRSAQVLATATSRMITGTEETFSVASRDELGAIAGSFNEINRALVQSRTLQRQVESDNRDLQENIMDLLQVVSDASDGDLTVRARVTTGALGNVADAFNSLLESLQSLIGEIDGQLTRTNAAVDEIANASRMMASGANSQADEVVAATLLVQEISQDMRNISENAHVASDAALRTQESAKEGTAGVNNVIQGMGTLRSNVQAGAKKMKNLGDRSMEITGIVEAINKISEKTNMLALNAAIEAARAKEHGHGFSIVAEEVRKLAEKTALATEEIERLVKTIHAETADTVEAIEKQTQFVEQESELVSKAGESLARISRVSTESAGLVAKISDVTTKQVEGVNKIVKAMGQISTIARSTQAGAEGTAKTVEQLSSLSAQLVQSLRRFKLNKATNGQAA